MDFTLCGRREKLFYMTSIVWLIKGYFEDKIGKIGCRRKKDVLLSTKRDSIRKNKKIYGQYIVKICP